MNGKKKTNHGAHEILPLIDAYSFPIVIRALKENQVGPPPRLAALDIPQRDELLVAFAAEMASVTTVLVVSAIRRITASEAGGQGTSDHSEKKSAESLPELLTQRESIHRELAEIEKLIVALVPAGIFVDEPGTIKNSLRLRDWLSKSQDSKKEPKYKNMAYMNRLFVAPLSKDHDKLVRQYLSADAKYKAALNAIAQPTQKNPPDIAAAWKSPLKISFDGGATILDDGCANLLRRHDRKWWGRFTDFIENEVTDNLQENYVKILLRYPQVHEDLGKLEAMWAKKTKRRQVKEILSFLEERAQKEFQLTIQWFNGQGVGDKFRTLWKRMKDDDLAAKAWILQKGGPDHPFNIYDSDKPREVLAQKMILKKRLQDLLKPEANQNRFPNSTRTDVFVNEGFKQMLHGLKPKHDKKISAATQDCEIIIQITTPKKQRRRKATKISSPRKASIKRSQ